MLSIGIGLAFAAMPNLIFDAVPQSETGEATGFNTLVRSVGASLGSQISAAILTGSVIAGTVLPSDDGYTTAFLVSAAIALVAALVALAIPRVGDPAPVAARAGDPPRARLRGAMSAAPRTRADAVRNYERVLAAASEVLAEKGAEAGVPEIAARAGVGKGTVYRCFPTKDHLVSAVLGERLRWFADAARGGRRAPRRRGRRSWSCWATPPSARPATARSRPGSRTSPRCPRSPRRSEAMSRGDGRADGARAGRGPDAPGRGQPRREGAVRRRRADAARRRQPRPRRPGAATRGSSRTPCAPEPALWDNRRP